MQLEIKLNESALYNTGQAWKYWIHIYLILIGLLLGVLSIWIDNFTFAGCDISFLMTGALVVFIGFVFASLSIRCPKCGDWWYWSAISKKHKIGGVDWFLSFSMCPACGEKTKKNGDTHNLIT